MNHKIIGKYMGCLLLLECALMAPSALLAIADGDRLVFRSFLATMLLCILAGGALYLFCRNARGSFYAREGFLITALGWILVSAVGALPFWFSREIPHYIDALFEVVSGFTTTGSSILTDVEAMSRGLLFWRSFTHWLGGMGILVFLLAVVPSSKDGHSVHVLRAESPGPSVSKLVPKLKQTAAILYLIYIAMTILCLIFLLIGRMPLFDALCTTFGTAGTGGFGIKADSMASYSPYLQNVCTVFMALFGINFSLYYLLLQGEWKKVLKNEELWTYLGIMFGSIAIITINIAPQYGGSIREALHHAAFTVSTLMTTTGFATTDFNLWPQLSRSLILLLMIVGATAGSTGGGIKCIRVDLLFKGLGAHVKRMLHPRSVNLIRVDGRTVDEDTMDGLYVYMTAYCIIALLSFLILSLDGFSLEGNLSAVLSCLNNIGPGLAEVGPTKNFYYYSDLSKIVLTLDMLLGRLEIFPLLILFSPRTWRREG